MKIRTAVFNSRRKGFEVKTSFKTYWFPYDKLETKPSAQDRIDRVFAAK